MRPFRYILKSKNIKYHENDNRWLILTVTVQTLACTAGTHSFDYAWSDVIEPYLLFKCFEYPAEYILSVFPAHQCKHAHAFTRIVRDETLSPGLFLTIVCGESPFLILGVAIWSSSSRRSAVISIPVRVSLSLSS